MRSRNSACSAAERIAGVRLGAPVARLLSEVLRAEGSGRRRDKIADAFESGVTIEAPLTLADHEAILEALARSCPPSLNGLRQRLGEERRYVRRVTGG
jgi:hypothetical protein